LQKKPLVKKDFPLCNTVKNSPRNNPLHSFWPKTRGARDRRRTSLLIALSPVNIDRIVCSIRRNIL